VLNFCSAGVTWPIESFDQWLRVVSRLTPVTNPAEAIRSILLRGVFTMGCSVVLLIDYKSRSISHLPVELYCNFKIE